MTVKASHFTPEVLLSAPRRSAGIPSPNGTKFLYTVSTYSFGKHSRSSEVRVLDSAAQESRVVIDIEGASDPIWLDSYWVLLLVPGEKGATKVLVGRVDDFKNSHYIAGTIDASAGDVKVKPLDKHSYAIAFSSVARPDGSLYNPEKKPRTFTTGRLYDQPMVRRWDTWVTENRRAIFYAKLSLAAHATSHSRFKMSEPQNAIAGTKLECPLPPWGGADSFDLSTSGIVVVSKDPEVNAATHTKVNMYVIPVSDFTKAPSSPQEVVINGFEGAAVSPVFTPDGKSAAVLKQKQDGYESDKNQIFYIPDVNRPGWVMHVLASRDGKGKWDRSPSALVWSLDGKTLYLVAEDEGTAALFSLKTDDFLDAPLPSLMYKEESISDVRPLLNDVLFLTTTSLIDNSIFSLMIPIKPTPNDSHKASQKIQLVSSNSRHGNTFGLNPKQIMSVRWPGAADGTSVHAWVMVPSDYNPSKTYPLAYLIHGGPQGAWANSWSTRWNPAVFAEQGYIVVCPNPTGSTGYGQAFTDAIKQQWGGLPYLDLEKGFDWIKHNMSSVDTDRAVALGASYGGYMVNWLQGQPLGRKFKALVCHDGVFSMTGQMSTDELYFPEREFGGKFWSNRQDWLAWDPSRYTHNWSTPQLTIHSELDYRLTMAEGLAAYNTLQDRGIESQFLTFPDENHWVLKPENSLLWHTVVLDWINKHVGLPKYSEQRKGGPESKVLDEAVIDQFAKLAVGEMETE